ncbi:MAG: GTPase HflX [Treponema sp.]|jgi:GTP-binding protein HflX|nr:GTPase HflX [Treponema sp.]
MIDIRNEEKEKIRCLLVGEDDKGLSELKELIRTLGMQTIQTITLTRREIQPAYGMGTGKVQEIAALAETYKAECIIFDFEIEPTKQRNWEKLAKIPVFDRQEVILRIFAQHAQTKEAVLQVELAQLVYSLPRLAHMYGSMARQRGGNYGAKGSGETQLELDQRAVRLKIQEVKKKLAKVISTRKTQRKKRKRAELFTVTLVGYTNAGKSSLLNALTGAQTFVEDKLFATLDPTTRQFSSQKSGNILLTDTVGFINNLPHSLIDAFKSTLEEAINADLLLIVIDGADQEALHHYETVVSVLREIGAEGKDRILILNKIDLTEKTQNLTTIQLASTFPGAFKVSAETGEGLDTLRNELEQRFQGELHDYIIPLQDVIVLNTIRRKCSLYNEKWLEDGIHITARVRAEMLASVTPYLVH